MIRIAVCDDNVPVADQIRQIWEAEAGKFWKDTQTKVFYDAESLIKADQEKVFDIYILGYLYARNGRLSGGRTNQEQGWWEISDFYHIPG